MSCKENPSIVSFGYLYRVGVLDIPSLSKKLLEKYYEFEIPFYLDEEKDKNIILKFPIELKELYEFDYEIEYV